MSARGGVGHEFISLDAFSLKACAEAAEKIKATRNRLDVLMLSQGMATIQVPTAAASYIKRRLIN